jgi:hypothetical protein
MTEELTMRPLRRIVIKEEFVELTHSLFGAMVMSRLIRKDDMARNIDHYCSVQPEIKPEDEWFPVTVQGIADELMIPNNPAEVWNEMYRMITAGWLQTKEDKMPRPDEPRLYRLDLDRIDMELQQQGYSLPRSEDYYF